MSYYKIDVVDIFIFHRNSWNSKIFGSFLLLNHLYNSIRTKLKSLNMITRGFKACLELSLPLRYVNHKIVLKYVEMLFARDYHNEMNMYV